MSFALGARVRIKASEHVHELSGAEVVVITSYVGVYPKIEGATYYNVQTVTPRERCRYCGAPRDDKTYACVSMHCTMREAHDWKDASILDVHEAWLEAL
jgi:hypothetical protein